MRLIAAMSRAERIVLGVLTIVLSMSFLMLLRMYYLENSELIPVAGGTYIEGAVGEVLPLNPWFVTGNDVSRDIVSLVFSGLMKYDPGTGEITNDLADVNISNDNRIYTATLKPNLVWHDSTEAKPHFVTADDVMFTFQTIQKQGFPNPILQQNFRGVEIEKIDERTVRFRLKKPYSFFTSNLTLGIIPQSAFDGVPVDKLDQTLDFGFHPIGAGPYSFLSLLQTDLSTEVTLKRFGRPKMPAYNIDRIVFRVFPEYNGLLSDIININGVRQVPRNADGQPILPRRFTPIPYTLPQYVGVFFNQSRPIPSDYNVRLGLQLATNKQEIVDAIHETKVIDTPLLEINLGDWQYTFDAAAAQGSFFDSNWNVPEKKRLQRLLEQRETNRIGPLSLSPRVALLSTGASLTLTGSTAKLQFPAKVNGIRVQTGIVLRNGTIQTLSGTWIVKLPAGNGMSGSLKIGMNILKMTNTKDDVIDSAYLERITDAKNYARATSEQQLVEQFIKSKQLPTSSLERITVQDMYLDTGFLRRKKLEDEPHTRINDRGEPLALTILTSNTPDNYEVIANILKKEWEAVGAKITVDIPHTKEEFQDKLTNRDYDVVLFGESLFDNLDSYPYWHSSQIQDLSEKNKLRIDAFNLSQYASFEADTLLERIRETRTESVRKKALSELNIQWKKDIPAIILYSPLSIFAHDDSVGGMRIQNPSLHADIFAHLDEWYVATKRRFRDTKTWFGFVPWMLHLAGG
jgi:ABC-type transport system substrate-binding protein